MDDTGKSGLTLCTLAMRLDCIRFAKGKVLSKSVNGKVEYWDPETLAQIRTFNIKNTASNQCRFDVRYDPGQLYHAWTG